jgi:uncharacterized membrane protein (UPF0127 family)
MRRAIDVLHLDRDGRVLRMKSEIAPGKVSWVPGSRHVVELAAGAVRRRGIEKGQLLRFQS